MKYHTRLKAAAKRMREHPTPAEACFAERLWGRGIHFRQQVVIGCYIADFVIPAKMLVVELDGGYHRKPGRILYDQKRAAYLQACGFKILRIANTKAYTYDLRRFRSCKEPIGIRKLERILKHEQKETEKAHEGDAQRDELKRMDDWHKSAVESFVPALRLVKTGRALPETK